MLCAAQPHTPRGMHGVTARHCSVRMTPSYAPTLRGCADSRSDHQVRMPPRAAVCVVAPHGHGDRATRSLRHDPIHPGEARNGCTPFYWQSLV